MPLIKDKALEMRGLFPKRAGWFPMARYLYAKKARRGNRLTTQPLSLRKKGKEVNHWFKDFRYIDHDQYFDKN